ncbi:uncharacterized protein J3D65DRAFT_381035 [Phyllosticta citribraziliensis]|uniref:Uncharacterized protein n=1 Tax=Phyllosticta citribraziliensis TaxID=989973 RepID=A0ABR1LQG6_9PEZI
MPNRHHAPPIIATAARRKKPQMRHDTTRPPTTHPPLACNPRSRRCPARQGTPSNCEQTEPESATSLPLPALQPVLLITRALGNTSQTLVTTSPFVPLSSPSPPRLHSSTPVSLPGPRVTPDLRTRHPHPPAQALHHRLLRHHPPVRPAPQLASKFR